MLDVHSRTRLCAAPSTTREYAGAVTRFRSFTILLLASSFQLACASRPMPASQPTPAPRKDFHLGDWEQDIGYSQAVRVGDTLYISGSAAGGAMPDAIRAAYDILSRTLRAHGLTFENVVKETVFTTDIEALKQHRALRKAYYGSRFPAASWVQIQRLYGGDHVIEVEAVAVFAR